MKTISKMRNIIFLLLIIMTTLFISKENVFAAEVSSFTELKSSIETASDGDTINVNADITLTDTLVISGKDITIKGSGTISAGSSLKTVPDRQNTLFVIKDSKVTFDGLTLDGASKNRVIYSENSNITLTSAKITNGCPGDNANKNPGGGIFLQGGSLTATETEFKGNTPGTTQGLGKGDGDFNGGAIYSGSDSTVINITKGSFTDNEVKAYGHGAAIYQENGTLNVRGTSFKNNKGHVEGGNAGTQGACIHTRDKVTATISGVNAEIAKGFNTGGFLRSWGSNVTVSESKFIIAGLGDGYGYSGGALCFENGTSEVKGSTFTCTGSKLFHAGGFIDIVGGGTHTIDGNTMTGSGKGNGTEIASFGGAISVEQGAKATVTIQKNTIKDSSASDNGGAIAIGTRKGASTPSTVTMSGNTISNCGTLIWGGQAGGALFVGPGATVTMSGDKIENNRAALGGGVYNEGTLTINGGSSLTGGQGGRLGGEINNNGVLTVDEATVNGGFIGFSTWEPYNPGHGKTNEYAGINIYAEKDVTITPKANITTGKDVRVIDGKSKILLTGPLNNQIDVSICEVPVVSSDPKIQPFEDVKRKVGYVVAAGNETYTPTAEDAKKIHYISKDTDTTQPRAEANDHTSPGMWDYVLDPEKNQIVLGQRVQLIYHGNLGEVPVPVKDNDGNITGTENKASAPMPVTVYKTGNFWEKQLDSFKVGDPTRKEAVGDSTKEYSFMGWYFWKFGENLDVKNNEKSIQELQKPETVTNDLFDFSKFDFSNKDQKETTNIITPNVINTYAGWSENIDIEVAKTWEGVEDKDKKDISVTLFDGEAKVGQAKTFTKENKNFGGKFENLQVFTKSYEGEEKNMNLRFAPKVYKVKEAVIEGFTTSYAPENITANSDVEKKITITNKKTYKVTYEFTTSGTDKPLPQVVKDLLPKEETGKDNNTKVEPSTKTFADVTTDEGIWTFRGWDKAEQTINGADVKFIGTWTLTPKEPEPTTKYKVTYEFTTSGTDKPLPQGIKDLLPKEETGKDNNTKVEPSTKTFANVTTDEGTWTFKGWAPTEQTINGADVKFIGTWTLTPKEPEPTTKYKVTYEFTTSGTDKPLPQGIKDLLPKEETGKDNNTKVEPSTKTFADVTTDEGIWTFRGWDKAEQTIYGADVKFIGTWKFTPKVNPNPPKPTTDIITKYVDESGNNIIPPRDGDQPVEVIPGYKFIETKRTEKVVTHIYNKIGKEDPNPWFPLFPSLERKEVVETHPVKATVPEKVLLNKEDHKAYMFGYPDWTFLPNNNMTRAEVTAMFARLLKNYPSTDVKYNLPYKDIFEKDWYYPAVGFMTENKIVTGYEDGSFRPNDPITRAEFATIASKFEDLLGDKVNGFYDVPASHWALKYINSAYARGWVAGYEDGSFRPDRFITRAEVVTVTNKMLIRYADVDFVRANKDLLINFKDLDEGHWAYFNIMEATHGHDFTRKSNGKDELWERLNGEAFIFPELRYKER